ncbi:MAG: glycosyltransferase family 39 protein [Deltaproteobacteria bacterium]|nr:glycosyltransferase family 39 protein [Deltaproteobacteria bacterium]
MIKQNIKNKIPDIIFWATALIILFWAFGDRGLGGSEDRWAEVTRQMFLTGDFFHPRINAAPYFDKPLLSYWFVALVSAVTGHLDEWAVRLPSALSGLLVLGATFSLGRKLWSEEVGRTAGWILLTTYGFIFWSRLGEADMANLAAITLAVAWYWNHSEKPGFLNYLVFYVIISLGAQTKGLASIIVPIIIILPDVLRDHRWKSHLNISHFLAVVLACLVYFAPFLYADFTREGYQSGGLSMVFKENIQRFIKPFDHKEPFYVYMYYVPELFLPWAPLFLAALFWAIVPLKGIKNLDRGKRWLIDALGLIFLFFTASGSRRVYYILPIIPFCSLLTSLFINSNAKQEFKNIAIGFQGLVFVLFGMIGIFSPAFWPIIKERIGFAPGIDFMLTLPIIGILTLTPLLIRFIKPAILAKFLGTEKIIAHIILMAAVIMGGFFCFNYVILDDYRTTKPFAIELKNQTADLSPKHIAFYRKIKNDVVFYLDASEPIRVLEDSEAVKNFFSSDNEDKILISYRKYTDELSEALPLNLKIKNILKEKIYPWTPEQSFTSKLVAWRINFGEKVL